MNHLFLTKLALLASIAAVPPLLAQTYNIPWHRIGPGGTSAGGAYAVSGSAGQLDAGTMSGGNLNLSGGFWVSASVPAGQAALYRVVELSTPDFSFSDAVAINNAGRIAGQVSLQAAFWSNSSSPVALLGNLDGEPFTVAFGINDSNHIVGYSHGFDYDATFWADSSSSPVHLWSPAGSNSAAYAINAAGDVVGYSELRGDTDSGPYIYYAATIWADFGNRVLGNGLGGNTTYAYAINDTGRIVGSASYTRRDTSFQAVFWDRGSGNFWATPLPSFRLGYDSGALAINASGQIVGFAQPGIGSRAVSWANSSSEQLVLGSLSAGPYTDDRAKGINASGQIVGYSSPESGSRHAVVWLDSTSPPIDLNLVIAPNSGWMLQSANGINNSGEIVGCGTFEGQTRAFALIPLPHPLRITSVARFGSFLQISFTSQAGHTYTVLSTSDLVSGPWSALQSGIPGNGGTVQVSIPNAFGQPRQFFRIQEAQ